MQHFPQILISLRSESAIKLHKETRFQGDSRYALRYLRVSQGEIKSMRFWASNNLNSIVLYILSLHLKLSLSISSGQRF